VAGIIDSVVDEGADALASMWELTLDGGSNWDALKVRVENVPLSLPKLTIDRLPNGETYYSGVEFPLDFSVTVREAASFKAFSYFNTWWSEVYDLDKRSFISYPGIIKGSSTDKIHRQGSLTFYTFKSQETKSIDIVSKERHTGFTGSYDHKELIQSLITGVLKNTVRSAASAVLSPVNQALGLLGKKVDAIKLGAPPTITIPHPVAEILTVESPLVLSSVQLPILEPKASCVFDLVNLKLSGFDSTQLSYEGGPLKFQVNFSAEDVRGSVKS
jgi:hypothetical protein